MADESKFSAMSTLPQGRAFVGRRTSLRTGSPSTPSWGAIAACADTWRLTLRQSATAATRVFEKNMLGRGGRTTCCEVSGELEGLKTGRSLDKGEETKSTMFVKRIRPRCVVEGAS